MAEPAAEPPDEQSRTPARNLQRRLRGGTRYLRRREVARSADVSVRSARKLWRALGFPVAAEEDAVFTDADVQALARVVGLVRAEKLDEVTAIALARALGQTTDRLVSWQTEALVEYLDLPAEELPERLVGYIDELADELEALLVYVWRRKLAESVSRLSADSGHPEDPVSGVLAVGFADLVSYTDLALRLEPRELGALVQRFEGVASDVITQGGGRVIKTVGDEVLFTAADALSGAVIALSLSERMAVDDLVPDVRVGLAYGSVLRSLGDVYGPTVNLASRLTRLAEPGTVVCDPETGHELARHQDLALVPQPPKVVRGFGDLEPLLVTRAGPDSALISID